MIAATHAAFATGLYLGGSALFEYPAGPVGWVLAVFFSIVPDIDLPTSRIGRPLFWLSVRLERQHGHRTVTHSLVALLLVAGVASPLFAVDCGDWYWAILGGYWSHLWLDMLNVRGIDLFWPSPIRVVMPGRTAYRLEVGSKAKLVLLSGPGAPDHRHDVADFECGEPALDDWLKRRALRNEKQWVSRPGKCPAV